MNLRKELDREWKTLLKIEDEEEFRISRNALWRFDPEDWSRHFFSGHCRLNFSLFHRLLFLFHVEMTQSDDIESRIGLKKAIAAPRGNAKTTCGDFFPVAHSVVYGLEPYTLIFSATQEQATDRVRDIRNGLQRNERINKTYSLNWSRCAEKSFECNGCWVEGRGMTANVRGMSHGEWRPSRIILDDIESDDKAASPDVRKKTHDDFSNVVENMGDTFTNFMMLGTVLHKSAILPETIKRSDFEGHLFKALESYPDNTTLWQQWRDLYTDLSNFDRQETSNRFYFANKPEMDKGASVLWPEKEDLLALQKLRVNPGERAFRREKQNDPLDPNTQVFFMENYPRFRSEGEYVIRHDGKKVSIKTMNVFSFLDPALGLRGELSSVRQGQRDFSAIVTIGVDEHGWIYVLNAWLSKALPDVYIKQMINIYQMYGGEVGFEAVGFQEVLVLPFDAELRRSNVAMTYSMMKQGANKVARIMKVEPMCANRWVHFRDDLPQEFFEQMETFPTGDHDDGPDALEGAIDLARQRGALKFAG